MTRRYLFAATLAVVTALTACAVAYDASEMEPLTAALTKVASKFDAFTLEAGDNANVEAVREDLYSSNTALMSMFSDKKLLFHIDGTYGSVVMCDEAGNEALVEDAGCSEKPDYEPWKLSEAQPCKFSLDLQKTCGSQ